MSSGRKSRGSNNNLYKLNMNVLRLQSRFLSFSFNKRFFSNVAREESEDVFDSIPDVDITCSVPNHIYAKKFTKSELVNYLVDNVVYNQDDIIVTNKPYGVRVGKSKFHGKPQSFNTLTFKDIQEDLAKNLNVNYLHPLVYPDRYSSGVTILATSENSKKILEKGIIAGKNLPDPIYRCVTVILGNLKEEKSETKFHIKLDAPNFKVKHKRLKNFNVIWKHEVVSSTNLCSLVKVKSSRADIRLFMASKCLAPILGDGIYSIRVKNVMGVPFYTDLTDADLVQEVHPEVLTALQLQQNEVPIIPTHVHLQAVTFPLYDKYKFFVSVPPPEHFLWTCSKLKLIEKEIEAEKTKFAAL